MRLIDIQKQLDWISSERSRLEKLEEHLLAAKQLVESGKPFPSKPDSLPGVAAVKDSLQDLENDVFKMEDLYITIRDGIFYDEIPKPALSAILSRMAKDGEIEVVEPGSGRRATIYKRIT